MSRFYNSLYLQKLRGGFRGTFIQRLSWMTLNRAPFGWRKSEAPTECLFSLPTAWNNAEGTKSGPEHTEFLAFSLKANLAAKRILL
jgi:hypothetical protein